MFFIVKILLAGDSTVAACSPGEFPMSGWGAVLSVHTPTGIEVLNFAKGGATTDSFVKEGLWSALLHEIRKGDIVLIQFGHNDQKPEHGISNDKYGNNLKKMIKEVQTQKGIAVLCTSVERRTFKDAVFIPTLMKEAEKVREIAAEAQLPLIDLQKYSIEMYQRLGSAKSQQLLTYFEAGVYPNYPKGCFDNTHFSYTGAKLFSGFVMKKLTEFGLVE